MRRSSNIFIRCNCSSRSTDNRCQHNAILRETKDQLVVCSIAVVLPMLGSSSFLGAPKADGESCPMAELMEMQVEVDMNVVKQWPDKLHVVLINLKPELS